MNLIDKIFKIGMLIVAIAFVYVYFLSTQNGRYQYFMQNDENDVIVFDTRTGIFHLIGKNQIVHIDLKNNKITHSKTEEHFGKLKQGTYKGKEGWYDEITSTFYPKESMEKVTYDGKKGLLNSSSNKFYEVEK